MSNDRGRFVPLSLPRRWIGDIMHFAKRVPVVAGERTLRIRPLLDARRSTPFAPGWYATIVKGFAMVSARIPELRQAYLPFPYPHLYEHPFSVATAIIDRTWDDEHATFLCPMKHPERRPLIELHDTLQGLKSDPIAAHGPLRRIVRTSRFPRPIRRALWALGLYASGHARAGYFGTFAVNTIAGSRGRMLQFMTPITSVIYFGAASQGTGEMPVQIAFDHRVFDGYTAGRALSELEGVLNKEIADETRQSSVRAAAA